jgi:hypothetical protein
MTTAMALKSGAVFPARIVTCVAYVALPIPRLVPVEVVERLLPALRHRPFVTVTRIVAVINVPIKAVMAMEPGASSDEHPASEPIRSIVAIGSTGIRSIVKVPIRAHRRHPNVDGDLRRCHGRTVYQRDCKSRESKRF